MSEKIYSKATGKSYTPSKVVRIVNVLQAATYMMYGAELLDIYSTRDYNTHRPMMVFIFDREATTPLYDAWCNRTLR